MALNAAVPHAGAAFCIVATFSIIILVVSAVPSCLGIVFSVWAVAVKVHACPRS
jgi:hypothetical protein